MFKTYWKYIASPEQLEDFIELKQKGLTDEEIEGYFAFGIDEEKCDERNKLSRK